MPSDHFLRAQSAVVQVQSPQLPAPLPEPTPVAPWQLVQYCLVDSQPGCSQVLVVVTGPVAYTVWEGPVVTCWVVQATSRGCSTVQPVVQVWPVVQPAGTQPVCWVVVQATSLGCSTVQPVVQPVVWQVAPVVAYPPATLSASRGCSGQWTICLSTGMYSYLTCFLGTWMYSTLFSGTYWGMYCLRYSTAQQSVTVTSLGMFSILRSSLYSTFLTFLGTRSTLAWSLYSMIFFSKGTYSILLSPLITSFPVLTVVPTMLAAPPETAQLPPETAQLAVVVQQLLLAPEPVPQYEEVGATQLEVVVVTGAPWTAYWAVVVAYPLQPMGSPVLPSTSWLEDIPHNNIQVEITHISTSTNSNKFYLKNTVPSRFQNAPNKDTPIGPAHTTHLFACALLHQSDKGVVI